MKITDVRAAYINVPLKTMFPPAIGGEASAHHTLVVVDTDEGVRGIGKCFRLAHEAMRTFIAATLRPLRARGDGDRNRPADAQLARHPSTRAGRARYGVHRAMQSRIDQSPDAVLTFCKAAAYRISDLT